MQKKKIYHIAVGYLQTNCWIVPLHTELENKAPAGYCSCAVIDPGDQPNHIIALLEQHKLFPVYIILTHGHFDHIGAMPNLVEEYEKRHGFKPLIAMHSADAKQFNLSPQKILAEEDNIDAFSVLHLPGHSPGGIGLLDKENGVLFSGDTLFYNDYGRTDLPGGSEDQLFLSLNRLFMLDENIEVYPGHGPVTTIGREKLYFSKIISS
ncbi:MAG: MBL fold metallo-hydrolase [Treponema sp.]|nr:MBL fold metallo-hydrolase [Treponema sp.]